MFTELILTKIRKLQVYDWKISETRETAIWWCASHREKHKEEGKTIHLKVYNFAVDVDVDVDV